MVLGRAGISRTRPAMPEARGEERERARDTYVSTIKSYWGPLRERSPYMG